MPLTTLERRSNIPREEFIRDYLTPRRPVLMEGMLDQWPAMHLWNADYLKQRCGQQSVEVMGGRDADPNYEINCHSHRRQVPFADYIDHVFSGQGNDSYLVANNRFLDTPTGRLLLADIPPPAEYFHPATNDAVHLWLGPAGTVTPLHYDTCDLVLTQVVGAKRVRMIDRADGHMLYNSRGVFSDVDYEAPDLGRFPLFAKVSAAEIILNAGDALFIPMGLWHQVRSLTPAISVSFTNFMRGCGQPGSY